jgi:hypothetical protein
LLKIVVGLSRSGHLISEHIQQIGLEAGVEHLGSGGVLRRRLDKR